MGLRYRRTARLAVGAGFCLFALALSAAGNGVPDLLPDRPTTSTAASRAEPNPPLGGGTFALPGIVTTAVVPPTSDPSAQAVVAEPSLDGPPAPAIERSDYASGTIRAVIVGIDRARGSRTLRGAVRDARSLRNALARHGATDDVTMLLDGAASRRAILSALADLARVPADGTAVFAFSGHAHRSRGEHQIRTADGATISASELAAALGRVRAPLVTLFGSCYAAGFDRPGITGPNRIAVFASEYNQLAYESSAFDRSFLFQYMVHEGMERAKAPGPSVESAFSYAQRRLTEEYPDQVPIISDGIPGEFVIGTPPATPEPTPKSTPTPEPERKDPLVGNCGRMVQVGGCRR